MIADWKMDFMAKVVAEDLWQNRAEAVNLALDMIKSFYKEEQSGGSATFVSAIRSDIRKQQKRLDSLIDMRADGEISREEFAKRRKAIDEELASLTQELELQLSQKNAQSSMDFDAISNALNDMAGLTADDIDPALLSKLVSKVVPTSDDTYDWYLNLSGDEQAKATVSADGRKTNAVINLEDIVQVFPAPTADSQGAMEPKNSYQHTLRDRPPSRMAGTK